jgi:hypothetical protein
MLMLMLTSIPMSDVANVSYPSPSVYKRLK